MRQNLFCGISVLSICLVLTTAADVRAQSSVNFRLEQIPVPPEFYVNGFNDQDIVVGHSLYSPTARVHLYDHHGVLGTPKAIWSLSDLINVPPEFSRTSIRDINNEGQLIAGLARPDGSSESILVELFDGNGNLDPTWQYLTTPASSTRSQAVKINDMGQIAGIYIDDDTGDAYGFVIDSNVPDAEPMLLTDPATGFPIVIENYYLGMNLNNLGQICGDTIVFEGDGAHYAAFRLTPGVELNFVQQQEHSFARDMNDLGEMTGVAQVVQNSNRKRKGQTTRTSHAFRFDSSGLSFPPIPGESDGTAINNAGDILGATRTYDGTRESQFLVRGNQLIDLDDVVAGSQDDVEFWLATTDFGEGWLNEADATGFGHIFIRAQIGTTTGKGKNQTTTITTRFFMLTPELP